MPGGQGAPLLCRHWAYRMVGRLGMVPKDCLQLPPLGAQRLRGLALPRESIYTCARPTSLPALITL